MRGRYCCKEQCPAEIRVRFCYGKGKHQRGRYRRARTWACRCDQRHGFRAGARHVRSGYPQDRVGGWARGICWEDGRENTVFGNDGYEVHIAQSVKSVGEEQRRVEDNVAILDAEHRRKTCATVRRRANLLGRIREVEKKWPIPRKPSLRRSPSEKPPMAKTYTISFGCVLGRVAN